MKINSNRTVPEEILCELYIAFSKGERLVGLNDLCNRLEKTESELYKVLADLNNNGLTSAVTNDSYKILPKGVIYTESNKLVSEAMISENTTTRVKILDELAILHETHGNSQSIHVQTIADSIKNDVYVILNNTDVLKHLDFIAPYLIGDFRITDSGLLDVKNRREHEGLSLEFKRVSAMEAHSRGQEFENFFAKLGSREGWKKETSTKTSNEEIDVILYRERDFFLVECKWKNKPIEAPVVREFYGKLDTREGMRGIIVSMSGFTKGAIEAVKDHMGKKVILLFGPKDINDIVDQDVKLEDLINEKYKQLMTTKKVLVN